MTVRLAELVSAKLSDGRQVSCKPLLTFASRCEDATVSYAIQGALYYRVRASTRKLARQHRQSERQTFEGQ
jgi:hypothetical protein